MQIFVILVEFRQNSKAFNDYFFTLPSVSFSLTSMNVVKYFQTSCPTKIKFNRHFTKNANLRNQKLDKPLNSKKL